MTRLPHDKSYAKLLPRFVAKRVTCSVMDAEGFRCDAPAIIEAPFHGSELTEKRAPWVAVYLCEFHGDYDIMQIEDKMPRRDWFLAKREGRLMFPDRRIGE